MRNLSTHVVGYQTDSTVNSSRLIAPTFVSVSSTPKQLKDLVPVSLAEADFTKGNLNISFYDNGSKRSVAKDAWITEKYSAAATEYGSEKVTFAYDQDKKTWYLFCDFDDKKYDMSDYPLNPGDGCLIKVSRDHGRTSDLPDAGVNLTYNGEVDKLATPICAINSSILSGNMSPRVRTLGDLTPVSLYGADFTKGNLNISFYDNGSKRSVAKDAWITEKYSAAATEYGSEKVTFAYDQDKKTWYLFCDFDDKKYDMKDYPIAPGEGFLMKVSRDHGRTSDLPDAGVLIQFPSAISAEK